MLAPLPFRGVGGWNQPGRTINLQGR